MDLVRYDFGYEWPWTWGHVIGAVVFALAAYAAWRVARPRLGLVFAAIGLWAIAGAAIVNIVLGFSLPIPLPTTRFLEGGQGRVLDAGAGSGRSSLMVLLARPAATRDRARHLRHRVPASAATRPIACGRMRGLPGPNRASRCRWATCAPCLLRRPPSTAR